MHATRCFCAATTAHQPSIPRDCRTLQRCSSAKSALASPMFTVNVCQESHALARSLFSWAKHARVNCASERQGWNTDCINLQNTKCAKYSRVAPHASFCYTNRNTMRNSGAQTQKQCEDGTSSMALAHQWLHGVQALSIVFRTDCIEEAINDNVSEAYQRAFWTVKAATLDRISSCRTLRACHACSVFLAVWFSLLISCSSAAASAS